MVAAEISLPCQGARAASCATGASSYAQTIASRAMKMNQLETNNPLAILLLRVFWTLKHTWVCQGDATVLLARMLCKPSPAPLPDPRSRRFPGQGLGNLLPARRSAETASAGLSPKLSKLLPVPEVHRC